MTALRDYQVRAIDELRDVVRRGQRRAILVSPTGSGKTTMGRAIVQGRLARGGRVLWLAHRRELVAQALATLTAGGIACTTARAPDAAAVVVATPQTITRRGSAPDGIDLVVFDEAHHYASDDWGRIGQAYASAYWIGLTATPARTDGRAMGRSVDGSGAGFDALLVATQVPALIEAGHLAPVDVVTPTAIVPAGSLAQEPVDAFVEHAAGRAAIVFAPHVQAAQEYAQAFEARGLRVATVWGEMPGASRAAALDRFARGELDVLCNVQLLTEGWDCPRAKVAILARSVGGPSLYLQIVGRVLRPFDGQRALVVDLTGAVERHGAPDEERIFSLDGDPIRRKGLVRAERFCATCGGLCDDDGVCPDCARGGVELETPHACGIALEPFARKRAENDTARVETLRRWLLVGHAKGHKIGAALHKYKAVYGHYPPRAVIDAAQKGEGHARTG